MTLPDPAKTYVYGEHEVKLTGRIALHTKSKAVLVEIEPIEPPTWKKFIRQSELYEISIGFPTTGDEK